MNNQIKLFKLAEIKPNENNPRIIKDAKFKKLVESIRTFPKMLNLKPIVIDEDNMILGGNMRYNVCKHIGLKEIPVIQEIGLSLEEKQEFIIKDNLSYGEWNWD